MINNRSIELKKRWENPEYRKHMSEAHKGHVGYWNGKKFSDEHRQNLKEAKFKNPARYWLGKKRYDLLGKHRSEETKIRISLALTGKIGNNLGKKFSEETKKKMSKSAKRVGTGKWCLGMHHSEETRRKISEAHKGIKCYQWKGGITPLVLLIRGSMEYRNWRKQVFERDNYTCQKCFKYSGKIDSHHINKSFSQILKEFLQQYNQFSPIDDKETLLRLAITYEPFWDLNNGQTLCKECHQETDTYAGKNNKEVLNGLQ